MQQPTKFAVPAFFLFLYPSWVQIQLGNDKWILSLFYINLSTIFHLEDQANQIALAKTGLVTTFSPLHSRPTK